MTEAEFATLLAEMIYENQDDVGSARDIGRVESFSDAGLLTMNEGLVVGMSDGSEFQLTIVKSR